jgi:predicted enzyme related to lactoylglutathione lyase
VGRLGGADRDALLAGNAEQRVAGGHFVDEQPVAGDAGLRPYVYVEDVPATVERILAHGGAIEKPPFAEGDLTVAVFRDPAGNVLGVWQFSAGS